MGRAVPPTRKRLAVVLNSQGGALQQIVAHVDAQEAKLTAQGEFLADLSSRLDAVDQQLTLFRERTCWQRLRWVICGV